MGIHQRYLKIVSLVTEWRVFGDRIVKRGMCWNEYCLRPDLHVGDHFPTEREIEA